MSKKRYSKEYQEQAVQMIRKGDRTLKEISRILGINYWTLRDWNQAMKQTPEKEEKRFSKSDKEELKRLRRENEDLRMENAILKKYAAILSKEQV